MNRKNMGMIARAFVLTAAVVAMSSCSDDNEVVVTDEEDLTNLYKGSDLSAVAAVTAESQSKATTIEIYKNGDWKLFPYDGNNLPDFTAPVLSGSSAGSFVLSGSAYARYCLEFQDSRTVIAPRILPIEGQPNFRDLGGYKTKEGKYIKWGLIFRSGKLSAMTDSDLLYLAGIPLKTVIDFRNEEEKAADPDIVPSTVVNRYEFSILSGSTTTMDEFYQAIATGDAEWIREMMMMANESFVLESADVYSSFFEVIMDESKLPAMFHCTAGKDRAGFGSAMFLAALGVDKETIFEDYLMTNLATGISLEDQVAEYGEKMGTAMYYVNSVQREYLQTAFDTIESNYDSIGDYLEKALKVDLEKMKSIYLY